MIPPFDERGKLGTEFFPTGMVADPEGTPFLDFFQYDRVGNQPKGILEMNLENGL